MSERRPMSDLLLDAAPVEREQILTRLLANLPGMAFRCAAHEPWPFEFASDGCTEITGWPPETFYRGGERTWSSIMHPGDVDRVSRLAAETFAARRQLTVTYRIIHRSGEVRWVWDRSLAGYHADGTVAFIEGFVTDVTAQKQAEDEARQRAELQQQLIGIVSHDLRSPLNVIGLAAETLLQRDDLDAQAVKTLGRIRNQCGQAGRLIRDLLDLTQARLGGGLHVEPVSMSLSDLAAHVVADAETLHPARELIGRFDGPCTGTWDRDRLAQAVGNLLHNALQYGDPARPVTVRTHEAAQQVMVEVHNHGQPITDGLRARLFEPMQRGDGRRDRSARSIGLGLYIVDQIARAHGGAVDVESRDGDGTTFRLTLPRLAGAAPA